MINTRKKIALSLLALVNFSMPVKAMLRNTGAPGPKSSGAWRRRSGSVATAANVAATPPETKPDAAPTEMDLGTFLKPAEKADGELPQLPESEEFGTAKHRDYAPAKAGAGEGAVSSPSRRGSGSSEKDSAPTSSSKIDEQKDRLKQDIEKLVKNYEYADLQGYLRKTTEEFKVKRAVDELAIETGDPLLLFESIKRVIEEAHKGFDFVTTEQRRQTSINMLVHTILTICDTEANRMVEGLSPEISFVGLGIINTVYQHWFEAWIEPDMKTQSSRLAFIDLLEEALTNAQRLLTAQGETESAPYKGLPAWTMKINQMGWNILYLFRVQTFDIAFDPEAINPETLWERKITAAKIVENKQYYDRLRRATLTKLLPILKTKEWATVFNITCAEIVTSDTE